MTRTQVSSGSPFEATTGFSRGVRVDDRIYIAGTAPVWLDGRVDPDPGVQARRCWEIALAALEELGGSPADVVRTRQFIVDREHGGAISTVHAEVFEAVRPVSTMVIVAGLLDPRWVCEMELDAVLS